MKTEYSIVEAFSIGEMIRKIDELLSEGWQCQGGISVTPFQENKSQNTYFEGLVFHQAIIRENKEKKPSKGVGF